MRAPGRCLAVACGLQATAVLAHARDKPTTYNNGLAYPKQRGSDYDYTSFPQDQQERADAVIEQFRFAWDGYYRYAYPHDSLQPLNNTYRDDRNGWGVTMVDALDTAIIMEQQDIVDVILNVSALQPSLQSVRALTRHSSSPPSTLQRTMPNRINSSLPRHQSGRACSRRTSDILVA